MTTLITSLSTGKGTWLEVSKLIKSEDWEHIYFIATQFAKDKFQCEKKHTFIVIDPNSSSWEIKKVVAEALRDKLSMDVAINLDSGTGKEHMAIISAALSLGVGIRFVGMKNNKVEEI